MTKGEVHARQFKKFESEEGLAGAGTSVLAVQTILSPSPKRKKKQKTKMEAKNGKPCCHRKLGGRLTKREARYAHKKGWPVK